MALPGGGVEVLLPGGESIALSTPEACSLSESDLDFDGVDEIVLLDAFGRFLHIDPGAPSVEWLDPETALITVHEQFISYDFQLGAPDVLDVPFIRSDANDDSLTNVADVVTILFDLFGGKPAAAPCRDALDIDDNGVLEMDDAIFLLSYLFQSGVTIPPPFPEAGLDPLQDQLPDCPPVR